MSHWDREVFVAVEPTIEEYPSWREQLDQLTADRWWLPRAVLLVLMAWITWHHWQDIDYGGPLAGINLGIHELGHLLFFWFGDPLYVWGGTIWQLLAPAIAAVMFWRQKDLFALCFALWWMGENLFGIARYIGDARALELPLVSYGPNAEHDWTAILSGMGLLRYDTAIAGVVLWAARISTLVMLLVAGMVVWRMLKQAKNPA